MTNMINDISSSNDVPTGFSLGKCKCGNEYAYCGLDLGYCVKCIDNMEEDDD